MSGDGNRTGLQAGTLLGWISVAMVALVVMLVVLQPAPSPLLARLPSPAVLLIAGVLCGLVGGVLCWPGLRSGQRNAALKGMVLGAGGAVLNLLVLSLTTMTVVVTAPI